MIFRGTSRLASLYLADYHLPETAIGKPLFDNELFDKPSNCKALFDKKYLGKPSKGKELFCQADIW